MKSLFAFLLCLFSVGGSAVAAEQQLLYLGTYPHQIAVIDLNSESVVDTIDLKVDIARMLTLAPDDKTIYAVTLKDGDIITVDLASKKAVSTFSLSSGNSTVRLSGITVDPTGKYVYGVGHAVIKKPDRYEIGEPQFYLIDPAKKKIVRQAEVPGDEITRGGRISMKLSPDGKYLYVFHDGVLVYNTGDFKLAKKIDLEKPAAPGMENVSLSVIDDPNEAPGQVIGLFNSEDPYIHQKVFGVARFDLEKTSFSFSPIGPATTSMLPLMLSPDRKTGYTVTINGTQGNRRCEMWSFDLATNRPNVNKEFPCRTRFSFGASADGTKLLIYNAGFQIDVYDAKTLEPGKIIELPGDTTTNLIVMPLSTMPPSMPAGVKTSSAAP